VGKSKAINVTFPDLLYESLKTIAESKNISLAAVVKIACSDYIEKIQK
jgi:hypothetical protein